ncbi:sulfotransferase family 2 domain-containing protein [Aliisedimentitalea scapharcae]|uniref:Sulfotransferase family 2 domain-containing protein n=1 Tax=Aliisedimentitalea scapharcae TaxID=1524259 RepID=A0ABZ2XT14_9RHOB
MILSTGRSYVFVHMPKTGGTALALALEARAKSDDIMLGDTPKARNRRRRVRDAPTAGRLWKHSTLSDIQGLVPDDVLRSLFAFTLVRNPWDRCVSYYHWLRVQSFQHAAVDLARALDFEAFASHPQTTQGFRKTPARAFMQHGDGSEQCACYIRLEHFAADAAPLFDHLGFTFDLPRVNASQREQDYRGYYSAKSRQAIAESCAEDIARFGYRF